MGFITGRVTGRYNGLKLLLYLRSGRWYVQPYTDQPFTTIRPDSSWTSATHLGSEYAALLVQTGHVPSAVVNDLPAPGNGVVAVTVTKGTPPVRQTWWFQLSLVLLAALAIIALYCWRMQALARQLNLRFEERLAERTRIAQEIHDTLLQGFLSASMQLHILADQLPPDSPQKEPLAHILKLTAKVIDEARNAVRGLRPSSDSSYDLEEVFSRLPQELTPHHTDFRIIAEGPRRTLHPIIRDEVYRIAREAVTNAFRHSGASKVEVELEYGDRELCVLVRDNGRGIDPDVLQSGREGHFGLSGMRDRAQNISAKLRVWSSPGAGTEVGLSVPGRVAFESQALGKLSRWQSKMYPRRSDSSRIRTRKMDA